MCLINAASVIATANGTRDVLDEFEILIKSVIERWQGSLHNDATKEVLSLDKDLLIILWLFDLL